MQRCVQYLERAGDDAEADRREDEDGGEADGCRNAGVDRVLREPAPRVSARLNRSRLDAEEDEEAEDGAADLADRAEDVEDARGRLLARLVGRVLGRPAADLDRARDEAEDAADALEGKEGGGELECCAACLCCCMHTWTHAPPRKPMHEMMVKTMLGMAQHLAVFV